MSSDTVHLLVVTSKDTPELKVLESLPACVNIVGIGRNLAELSHLTPDDWASVEVMLNCGVLKNATTKESIQVSETSPQCAAAIKPDFIQIVHRFCLRLPDVSAHFGAPTHAAQHLAAFCSCRQSQSNKSP